MLPSLEKKVTAKVSGAEAEGPGLWIRFAPVAGYPREVVDYVRLAPQDDTAVVQSVGRLLRILRAGRVRAPADPYALAERPEEIVDLVERCRGTTLKLTLARRFERSITLWTEVGVEKIDRVVDFQEDGPDLAVRRRGTASLMRIPRKSLIRYAASSDESFEVRAVELAS